MKGDQKMCKTFERCLLDTKCILKPMSLYRPGMWLSVYPSRSKRQLVITDQWKNVYNLWAVIIAAKHKVISRLWRHLGLELHNKINGGLKIANYSEMLRDRIKGSTDHSQKTYRIWSKNFGPTGKITASVSSPAILLSCIDDLFAPPTHIK